MNEALKVNGVGLAKLVFQENSHLFLDFPALNLFHKLLHTCQPVGLLCRVQSHNIWKPVSEILMEPIAAVQEEDKCQNSPPLSVSCCRMMVSDLLGLGTFYPSPFVFAAG